jgi:hypothetical protein
VKDVNPWLLSCPVLAAERKDLLAGISVVSAEFQEMGEEEQVAIVLQNACRNSRIHRVISRMWSRRFYD